MGKKTIQFGKDASVYSRLARQKTDKGDYLGGLGYLFTAKKLFPDDYNLLGDIARTYASMKEYELSSKYWYYYISLAPKKELHLAYEGLATNGFNLGDVLKAGYYAEKRFSDGTGEFTKDFAEELKRISEEENLSKNKFFVAYPYERADYKEFEEKGREEIAMGEYDSAEKTFDEIPSRYMSEEIFGEYALTCFLIGKNKKAKDICKASLEKYGENATAYCNLSSVYHAEHDRSKSEYYYSKALEVAKDDKNENYKILVCSIEQQDHKTAKIYLKKVCQERPFDALMNLYYSFALANTGDYDGCLEQISYTYKTVPEDYVVGFYFKLFKDIAKGNVKADKYLPLEYKKVLPKVVCDQYAAAIDKSLKAMSTGMRTELSEEIVEWSLLAEDTMLAKKALTIYAFIHKTKFVNLMKRKLIDNIYDGDRIAIMVLALLIEGYRGDFFVTVNSLCLKIKPQKVLSDTDDNQLFSTAYAFCITKAVLIGLDDVSRISQEHNKFYKEFKDDPIINDLGFEELGAVIFYFCKYKAIDRIDFICDVFCCSRQKVKETIDYVRKKRAKR